MFERGKRSRGKRSQAPPCHRIGSKAWFCREVRAQYFLDDADDHCESVSTILPDNAIQAFQVMGQPKNGHWESGGSRTILAHLNSTILQMQTPVTEELPDPLGEVFTIAASDISSADAASATNTTT